LRRRRPLVLKLESSPFARTGACQPRNGLPLIRTFGSQTVQRKSNEHLVTVAASSGPAMTMEVSPDYRDSKLRSGPLSSGPYSFVFSLESFSRMNASISGALGASPEQSAVLFFGDREVYRPDAAATLSRSPDCCSGLGSFAVDGHTFSRRQEPGAWRRICLPFAPSLGAEVGRPATFLETRNSHPIAQVATAARTQSNLSG
jgi:hypothetical protein